RRCGVEDDHVESRSLAVERNEGRDRSSLARSAPAAGTSRTAADNARAAGAVVGEAGPLSLWVAFIQWRARAQPNERNRSGPHPAAIVAPGKGVFEPVLVVALRVILARMCAAALGAVSGGMEHDRRLPDQIVELERLDQIGVPDHRAIGDREITEGLRDLGHL